MPDPATPAADGSGDPEASGAPTPASAPPAHAPAPAAAAPPYGLAPASAPPAPAAPAFYAQPVYAAAPPTGLSLTSMILGFASLFFFWTFLVPIVGVVFACIGLKREPAGRGFAITGLILNGILVLIPVVLVLFLILAGSAMFGIAATTSR